VSEDEHVDEAEEAPPPAPEAWEPPPSRGPRRPSADTDKTLGLEVSRLFGLNPRLLVDPEPGPKAARRTGEDAAGGDDLLPLPPEVDAGEEDGQAGDSGTG
jgi:hypothetical protein